eukprot:TRINITY_DN2808_c0_g2_i7.p1 TRINITY_DN2808_c0_g2~~TRINITY_DN2808_c0_g2_i7.p1  ORF type:complete len:306 (+),score=89.09 TRINITY_DN2808_c0_g2_i7:167-1084(+)
MIKPSNLTHFCNDHDNKYFAVFNVGDKIAKNFEVPYETTYLFDSVQINDQIIFTGGGMSATKTKREQFFTTAIKVVIEMEEGDFKPTKLAEMNVPRANHTLAALNHELLYVVGGWNSDGEIAACEEYVISKNQWTVCASLNEAKMWTTVCPVNGRYLYAFGGSAKLKPKELGTIECLDTNDKTAKKWTKIVLSAGADIWPCCFFMGGIQIEENSVILFGGLQNESKLDSSFYFNPGMKTITKGPSLMKKDAFYRSKPGINGNEVVIVGSTEGDLHIYDIVNKSWNLMLKATWNSDQSAILKSETY